MSTLALEVLPPIPKRSLKKIMSLRDLWTIYVKLKGNDLAPYTYIEYASVGKMFCTFMENRRLEPMAIVEFAQSLIDKGTIGNNRINTYLSRVRGFLRFLKNTNYIGTDLWLSLPNLPKQPTATPQIFTDEDYETIKTYCKDKGHFQPHLWLLILAYRTGMSKVDCCYLRWRDVHLNENGPSFIDIYRIKTKRLGQKALCQIPIIPFTDVHEWLINLKKVEHLNYKRHDGITDFVHQDCPGLYECRFQRIDQDFRNIFLRAGIDSKKTFRHMRNTFCSNLINSGTQIALICKMTGHSNVATLLRYLKPDRRALQDGLSKAFQYAASESGTGKTELGFELTP